MPVTLASCLGLTSDALGACPHDYIMFNLSKLWGSLHPRDSDQGVEGTTDPSGIDAAASAKNGAKIVYQDTNNSSIDFHLRKEWSLK